MHGIAQGNNNSRPAIAIKDGIQHLSTPQRTWSIHLFSCRATGLEKERKPCMCHNKMLQWNAKLKENNPTPSEKRRRADINQSYGVPPLLPPSDGYLTSCRQVEWLNEELFFKRSYWHKRNTNLPTLGRGKMLGRYKRSVGFEEICAHFHKSNSPMKANWMNSSN